MKALGLVCAAALLGCVPALAQSSFTLRFDRSRYDIAPGASFHVSVLIEPTPTAGLFSYGLKLAFDSQHANVSSASAIIVPAALDFNSVRGPGAVRLLGDGGDGLAATKGTVDFFANPFQTYPDALLGTFNVTDMSVPGPYQLNVGLFNTLGPTEEIFVSGDEAVLDPLFSFASATVNYRPLAEITSPANGASFVLPATIQLTAEATDLDGQVTKVEFFDGANKLGESSVSPYRFTWVNASVGTHVKPSSVFDST